MNKEKYNITGMTCSACVSAVEKSVRKLDGIRDVNINLLTNTMSVDYDHKVLTSDNIIFSVEDAGYEARLVADEDSVKSQSDSLDLAKDAQQRLKKRVIYSFLFLIPLMYLSMAPMLYLPIPSFFVGEENILPYALTLLVLTLPVYVINWKFFSKGFKSLWKLSPTMDSLVAIGSSAALIYGLYAIYSNIAVTLTTATHLKHELFFESGATILTLITLGKYFEARAKNRTSDALNRLISSAPQNANVIRNDEEVVLPIEEVRVNDTIIIRPGQKIPVDGVIVSGYSAVDESTLTGESMPVLKQVGDTVLSGSINKSGSFVFKASKVGNDTTLAQIIALLEDVSASKAPISRLADKISAYFVPIVILIAIITFGIWMLLGYPMEFALTVGISVLIISCPCALGLATPVAIMVGTGKGASFGILFKSAEALEIGEKINTILLDKTGTITEGKPQVTDIDVYHYMNETQLLQVAASLEQRSEHPIANAIIEKAKSENLNLYEVNDFFADPGKGLTGTIDDEQYWIGNEIFISEKIEVDRAEISSLLSNYAKQGKTPLLIADTENILGVIAVADTVKPSSKEAITLLKKMNYEVVMVTGDNKETANVISMEMGIDRTVSEVLPQDKDKVVKDLQAQGKRVAMVGDGVNDAPALMRSDMGFAIGSGTDIAIESADVVLLKNDLMDVFTALQLSKATLLNIKQNLFWAFFYNVIGIPIAAGALYLTTGVTLSPMMAATAMGLSSITVVTNALRLKRFRVKTFK